MNIRTGLAALLVLTLTACAKEVGGDPPAPSDGGIRGGGGGMDRDAGFDGGPFDNADRSPRDDLPDAALISLDATPTADAFFLNDPPPAYCGPDAGAAPMPEGTVHCPGDKNREGCPCAEPGMQAACWPGLRVHRDRGICKDGTTVCRLDQEFGPRWGACEGYVLPDEEANAGPRACGCFSSGTWAIDNIAPCVFTAPSGKTYLYSSRLGKDGRLDCGSNVPEPPPVPEGNWSENTLNVDCGGQFELCFTIKAGDVDEPRADDCVIMQHCVDVWYPEAGETQTLPPIAAWSASDTACAAEFGARGGYAEMSVLGESVACDVIDDGDGVPYIFHRTNYCPPSCQDTPDTPECRECRVSGSGMFGP